MEEHINLISVIVEVHSDREKGVDNSRHREKRRKDKCKCKSIESILSIVSGVQTFKRKSNKEQFKHNLKINLALGGR